MHAHIQKEEIILINKLNWRMYFQNCFTYFGYAIVVWIWYQVDPLQCSDVSLNWTYQ